MIKSKKLKKESSNTTKAIFFGWVYSCKECGKLRGVIKNKDYSQKRYRELKDKYTEELKCAERGIMLLSSCMPEDENMLCPTCRKLKGIKVISYPEFKF